MYTIEDYLFWWGVLVELFILYLIVYFHRKNHYWAYTGEMRTCIFIFVIIAFFMWIRFIIPNQQLSC